MSYKDFSKKELILRDHLAIDRTILANERTLLSYARTSLGVLAAGASLVHFFSEIAIKSVGGLLLIVGVGVLIVGFYRYRKMKILIDDIRKT